MRQNFLAAILTLLTAFFVNHASIEDRPVNTSLVGHLDKNTAFTLLDSTVRITTPTGSGTGIILSCARKEEGYVSYVLTNNHVVGDNEEVRVDRFIRPDNKEIVGVTHFQGKVVLVDSAKDLVLLEINSDISVGLEVDFATASELEEITVYEPVFISGCGVGLPPFITSGNLSVIENDHYIATAQAIFGNSGGGMYLAGGELVGIVQRIGLVPTSDGRPHPVSHLSFIIPIKVVKDWLYGSDYSFVLMEII